MQEKLAKRTRVYRSNSITKSMKTSVPGVYVEVCGITEDDELEWTHEKLDGGECILKVRVVKGTAIKSLRRGKKRTIVARSKS